MALMVALMVPLMVPVDGAEFSLMVPNVDGAER
jgi:hypothetical protein